MHESRWRVTVWNYSGSGAYGIPQALPASKMRTAGADYMTNGITQVKWMLGYLKARYGGICSGYRYWLAHHSY